MSSVNEDSFATKLATFINKPNDTRDSFTEAVQQTVNSIKAADTPKAVATQHIALNALQKYVWVLQEGGRFNWFWKLCTKICTKKFVVIKNPLTSDESRAFFTRVHDLALKKLRKKPGYEKATYKITCEYTQNKVNSRITINKHSSWLLWRNYETKSVVINEKDFLAMFSDGDGSGGEKSQTAITATPEATSAAKTTTTATTTATTPVAAPPPAATKTEQAPPPAEKTPSTAITSTIQQTAASSLVTSSKLATASTSPQQLSKAAAVADIDRLLGDEKLLDAAHIDYGNVVGVKGAILRPWMSSTGYDGFDPTKKAVFLFLLVQTMAQKNASGFASKAPVVVRYMVSSEGPWDPLSQEVRDDLKQKFLELAAKTEGWKDQFPDSLFGAQSASTSATTTTTSKRI